MSLEVDVLVVGSVNVDLVVTVPMLPLPGATVTGGTFERHGGGKSANQAVAAARLGARVALIAAVGDDAAGDEAIAELHHEGIDTAGVSRLTGVATGVALIVVDNRGENQIAVASGANEMVDDALVASALSHIELAPDGVCLLGFEVGNAALETAAQWASGSGHRVIIDPAPARPLSEVLASCKPLLTPNTGEAGVLIGESSPDKAAVEIARSTLSPVIVTLGEHGAVVADGDTVETFAPFRVEAVDTTGAGDTFSGALAANLSDSRSLPDAVSRAQAAAALSTKAAGARSGMPTVIELDRFLAGIETR